MLRRRGRLMHRLAMSGGGDGGSAELSHNSAVQRVSRRARIFTVLGLATLLLAVVAALQALQALPLQAQQVTVNLVRNDTDTIYAGVGNRIRVYQTFTTGPDRYFTITEVGVRFQEVSGRQTSVRLAEYTGGDINNDQIPGSVLVVFDNPTTLQANALNTFTVPAGTELTLSPNTTYWLTVNQGVPAPSAARPQTKLFGPNQNDEESDFDWSIGDSSIAHPFGVPLSSAGYDPALAMQIRGFEAPAPPILVSSLEAQEYGIPSNISEMVAQRFRTGSGFYSLTRVEVYLGNTSGRNTRVRIREDAPAVSSDDFTVPGELLVTLDNPASLTSNAVNEFTASAPVRLKTNTSYWITVGEGIAADSIRAQVQVHRAEVTGESGLTMPNEHRRPGTGGVRPWGVGLDRSVRLAIFGETRDRWEVDTLSALTVRDRHGAELPLSPAFASDEQSYTLNADYYDGVVTIDAQLEDGFAGLRVRGGPDASTLKVIGDRDPDKQGFQAYMEPGEAWVFWVEVVPEGGPDKAYVLNVSRNPAPDLVETGHGALIENRFGGSVPLGEHPLSHPLHAQQFTTGPDAAYTISAVDLYVSGYLVLSDDGGALPPERQTVTLRLMSSTGDSFGEELGVFEAPSSIEAYAYNRFTLDEPVELLNSTRYWLVINDVLANTKAVWRFQLQSDDDDDDSYFGWTMANKRLVASPGQDFARLNGSLVMKIRGSVLYDSELYDLHTQGLKGLILETREGDPIDFSPAFDPTVFEYEATVDYPVSRIQLLPVGRSEQLLEVYDRDGNDSGLSGHYFDLEAQSVTRTDAANVFTIQLDHRYPTPAYTVRVKRIKTPRVVIEPKVITLRAGETQRYSVKLDAEPTANVRVNVLSPSDGQIRQILTFTSSNWHVAQWVNWSGGTDDDNDVNDSFEVEHSVSSADSRIGTRADSVHVNLDERSPRDYYAGRITVPYEPDGTLGQRTLPDEVVKLEIRHSVNHDPVRDQLTVESHNFAPTGIWGDADEDTVWVVDQDHFGIHPLKLSALKEGRIERHIAANTSEYDYRFNYDCHFKPFAVGDIWGNTTLSVTWGNDNRIWVANGARLDAYSRFGSRSCSKFTVTALTNTNVTAPAKSLTTRFTRFASSDYALNSQLRTIYGVWSDGDTMWLSGRNGVYALDMTSGQLRKSDRFGHDTVYGLWSDGTHMWAASRDWLRAYNLRTGARNGRLDIKLRHSGSEAPGDIWSDRGTIWVTYRSGAIDAYELPGGDYKPNSFRSLSQNSAGDESQDSSQLTARISEAPASHDGTTEFGVQIEFSRADLRVTAQALRDALTVLGAELVDVAQVDGRLDLWELRLQPHGSGSVSILLQPSGKCPKKGGALCTTDDLPLTNSLGLQLPGTKGGKVDSNLLKSLESESPLDSAPEAPGQPRPRAVFIGGVDLEWDAVRGAESYEVQFSSNSPWLDLPSGDIEIAYYGAGAIISGVDPQSTLWFRLRAANGHGVSDWSPMQNMNATNEFRQGRQPRPANQPATGAPVIRGNPAAGATLWADISEIEDGNGLQRVQFQYQWIAGEGDDATEIADATQATYIWTEADAERSVSLRVSFVDRGGYAESLTSEAVTEPPPPNTPASGDLTIDGTAQVGETLTADTSTIRDADGLTNATYKYQWLAGGLGSDVEIADATESTYVVGESDVGRNLRVRVSFSDDAGNPEVMTSAQTETVTYAVSEQVVNTPAEGSLTVTGTQRVGETLTADPSGITDADGLEEVSFSYQWKRYHLQDDIETEITGATGASYELTDDDFGHVVGVSVSFSDDAGHPEEMHSGWLAISPRLDTPPTGDVTITGTPRVGETLTADTSAITDADGLTSAVYEYQWLSDDDGTVTEIADATGSNYTLQESDEDHLIQVQVTITDDREFETTLSSDWLTVLARLDTPAVGDVTITGTPQVGETLTADTSAITDADGLTNAIYEYQWLSDDDGTVTEIADATGSTYTLQESDEDNLIQVQVTITDDRGFEATLSSDWLTVSARLDNSPVGDVTITGTPRVGETLTADTSAITDADGLTNAVYEYQWMSHEDDTITEIGGATDSSYTLEASDAGDAISVRVKITDDRGFESTWVIVLAQLDNPAAGEVTVTGTAQIGETLTADISAITDADGLTNASYAYQWLSDDSGTITEISGATGSTYTLQTSDEDTLIQVQVTITDDRGFESTLSSEWLTVQARPDRPAAGEVTVTGMAQVGETLTANTSAITDADGLTNAIYTYQWLSDEDGTITEISGATGSTYTLQASDGGAAISVRVKVTDDRGFETTLTSAATESVTFAIQEQIVNTPAAGSLTITGTQRVGETLTADPSQITDADGLEEVSFSYQWKRYHLQDDIETEITGATGASYELTDDDFGHVVGVSVRFSDDAGHPEEMHSGWLAISARLDTPPQGEVTITGTRRVGETLSADTSAITDADGLTNASYAYQWLSDEDGTVTKIAGATGSTYTLQASDEDNLIQVQVTITDDRGFETTLSSDWLTVLARLDIPPAGVPTIKGTAQVGETLTADVSKITDADGLTSVSYEYQWLAVFNGLATEISGATGPTYTLQAAEEGAAIKVRVQFADDRGHPSTLTSAATDTVAAALEPPAKPDNLTASVNADGSVRLSWEAPSDDTVSSYRILRRRPDQGETEFLVLVGDTGSTATEFTDRTVEPGVRYVYRVAALNGTGTGAQSDSVEATPPQVEEPVGNREATGAPVIQGAALVGETLTVDLSGITDADGLSGAVFRYQWILTDGGSFHELRGATDSAYTIVVLDRYVRMLVRVSFIDDRGHKETRTSAPTDVIR